jgi:hypothetical protein
MGSKALLKGQSILVVEDDALIRFDLMNLFESVGAQNIHTRSWEQAIEATEHITSAQCASTAGYSRTTSRSCVDISRRSPTRSTRVTRTLSKSTHMLFIVEKPARGEGLLGAMMTSSSATRFDRADCIAMCHHRRAIVKSASQENAVH